MNRPKKSPASDRAPQTTDAGNVTAKTTTAHAPLLDVITVANRAPYTPEEIEAAFPRLGGES